MDPLSFLIGGILGAILNNHSNNYNREPKIYHPNERQPKEFELIVRKDLRICWDIRECPICNSFVGYMFRANGKVRFGCFNECFENDSSYDEVATYYNSLKGEERTKADKSWGFIN